LTQLVGHYKVVKHIARRERVGAGELANSQAPRPKTELQLEIDIYLYRRVDRDRDTYRAKKYDLKDP